MNHLTSQIIADHVQEQFPRILQYSTYTLILSKTADLFLIGRNCFEETKETHVHPKLIRSNVKSAAGGINYLVYVDLDGIVHVLGNGPLKERFAGFSHAVKVISEGFDEFWIEDENHNWHVMGFNKHEKLAPLKTETIHTYLPAEYAVVYRGLERGYAGNFIRYDIKISDQQLKSGHRYQELVLQYGEDNLSLEFKCIQGDGVEEEHRTNSGSSVWWQDEFVRYGIYEVSVNHTNYWIFNPIPAANMPEKEIKHEYFYHIEQKKMLGKNKTLVFSRKTFNKPEYWKLKLNERSELTLFKGKKPDTMQFFKSFGFGFIYMTTVNEKLILIDMAGNVWYGDFSETLNNYEKFFINISDKHYIF